MTYKIGKWLDGQPLAALILMVVVVMITWIAGFSMGVISAYR